jgi:hypothetical protein
MKIRYVTAAVLSICLAASARAEIRHRIDDVPRDAGPKASVVVTYERQLPDYCGEACFVMALMAFGVPMTQREIHRASGLLVRRGCWSDDLYAAALALGIEGDYVIVEGFDPALGGRFLDYLKHLLWRGMPVVLSFNEDPRRHRYDTYEHFVLATGYDDAAGTVTIMDPDLGPETGRELSTGELVDRWQWQNPDGSRGCLMFGIGGMRDDGPAPMDEVGGSLEEGQRVDYLYEAESTGEYFFFPVASEGGMALSIQARDGDGRPIGRWETDDLDNILFSLSGVERAYITIECIHASGDWRLRYEAGRVTPVLY